MTLNGRDTILVVGSTMRLTRLVVADDLGAWVVKWPAYRWANQHQPPVELTSEQNWRSKLVLGLDCPFCVGTWIGFGVLAITTLSARHPRLARLWRFVMAGLTLNEVSGHLGVRLGDVASED